MRGHILDADAKSIRLRKCISDISAEQYLVFREDPCGAGGSGSPFCGEASVHAAREWCFFP